MTYIVMSARAEDACKLYVFVHDSQNAPRLGYGHTQTFCACPRATWWTEFSTIWGPSVEYYWMPSFKRSLRKSGQKSKTPERKCSCAEIRRANNTCTVPRCVLVCVRDACDAINQHRNTARDACHPAAPLLVHRSMVQLYSHIWGVGQESREASGHASRHYLHISERILMAQNSAWPPSHSLPTAAMKRLARTVRGSNNMPLVPVVYEHPKTTTSN